MDLKGKRHIVHREKVQIQQGDADVLYTILSFAAYCVPLCAHRKISRVVVVHVQGKRVDVRCNWTYSTHVN